jgi:hypothetical protein
MDFQLAAAAYEQACKAVKQAIKDSPYKVEYWIQQLGFGSSPTAYYRRLKSENWEPEHLAKIGLLLAQK